MKHKIEVGIAKIQGLILDILETNAILEELDSEMQREFPKERWLLMPLMADVLLKHLVSSRDALVRKSGDLLNKH